MEEDQFIPLILGRRFLNMAKASIHVHEGKLTLRIEDDCVNFNIFRKEPKHNEQCFKIEFVNSSLSLSSSQVDNLYSDPLADSLIQQSSVRLQVTNDDLTLEELISGDLQPKDKLKVESVLMTRESNSKRDGEESNLTKDERVDVLKVETEITISSFLI